MTTARLFSGSLLTRCATFVKKIIKVDDSSTLLRLRSEEMHSSYNTIEKNDDCSTLVRLRSQEMQNLRKKSA